MTRIVVGTRKLISAIQGAVGGSPPFCMYDTKAFCSAGVPDAAVFLHASSYVYGSLLQAASQTWPRLGYGETGSALAWQAIV
jgi:hypothetical protein